MKLVIDGIIENLQSNGGCTVYFNQILSFLQKDNYRLDYLKFSATEENNIKLFGQNTKLHHRSAKLLERWRDVDVNDFSDDIIFHSTHYRLPNRKVKTVTTVHDFTYELYRHGPARWMHSWQKFRAIRNSDLVICVSHNTAKDLMRFCPIDEKKIRVVHNGVSETYVVDAMATKTNEVVFVGARGWYKNFIMAVKSLVEHPDLQLSIVGGGALTADEISLLDEHIPNRYQWLGRVSDEELNEIYNRAYCLLYPSSYEGFGIPVIEAMKSGCPVIAVHSSSIPEVACDAAILVESASVENFQHALSQLASASHRETLIQRGLLQAAKFSWEQCYRGTLAVYQELAG